MATLTKSLWTVDGLVGTGCRTDCWEFCARLGINGTEEEVRNWTTLTQMLDILICLLQIKDLGVKAGVVLNPGTSLTAIEEVPFSSPALLFSANPFLHSCLAGNAHSLPARKLPVYHLASLYFGVHGCHW